MRKARNAPGPLRISRFILENFQKNAQMIKHFSQKLKDWGPRKKHFRPDQAQNLVRFWRVSGNARETHNKRAPNARETHAKRTTHHKRAPHAPKITPNSLFLQTNNIRFFFSRAPIF